jgi:FixJ family two-component response regulator
MSRHFNPHEPLVYVIDDNAAVRDSVSFLLSGVGLATIAFGSIAEFLSSKSNKASGCLVLDVRMPGMSGLEFQERMEEFGIALPIVFVSGHADVLMAVQAMKAGAVDFLCKPFREQSLLDAVRSALAKNVAQRHREVRLSSIQRRYDKLTSREKQVLWRVASGLMNKQIAHDLGLSEITVKVHRASVVRKMEAKSVAELIRNADFLKAEKKYALDIDPVPQSDQNRNCSTHLNDTEVFSKTSVKASVERISAA